MIKIQLSKREISIGSVMQLSTFCDANINERETIAEQVLANSETFNFLITKVIYIYIFFRLFPKRKDRIAELALEPKAFSALTLGSANSVAILVEMFPQYRLDIAKLTLKPHTFNTLIWDASKVELLIQLFPEYRVSIAELVLEPLTFRTAAWTRNIKAYISLFPEYQKKITDWVFDPVNFSVLVKYIENIIELLNTFPEYRKEIGELALNPIIFDTVIRNFHPDIENFASIFPEHQARIVELILTPLFCFPAYKSYSAYIVLQTCRLFPELKELIATWVLEDNNFSTIVTNIHCIDYLLRAFPEHRELIASRTFEPRYFNLFNHNAYNVVALAELFPEHNARIAKFVRTPQVFNDLAQDAYHVTILTNAFPDYKAEIAELALSHEKFWTIWDAYNLDHYLTLFPEHSDHIAHIVFNSPIFNEMVTDIFAIRALKETFPKYGDRIARKVLVPSIFDKIIISENGIKHLKSTFPNHNDRIDKLISESNSFHNLQKSSVRNMARSDIYQYDSPPNPLRSYSYPRLRNTVSTKFKSALNSAWKMMDQYRRYPISNRGLSAYFSLEINEHINNFRENVVKEASLQVIFDNLETVFSYLPLSSEYTDPMHAPFLHAGIAGSLGSFSSYVNSLNTEKMAIPNHKLLINSAESFALWGTGRCNNVASLMFLLLAESCSETIEFVSLRSPLGDNGHCLLLVGRDQDTLIDSIYDTDVFVVDYWSGCVGKAHVLFAQNGPLAEFKHRKVRLESRVFPSDPSAPSFIFPKEEDINNIELGVKFFFEKLQQIIVAKTLKNSNSALSKCSMFSEKPVSTEISNTLRYQIKAFESDHTLNKSIYFHPDDPYDFKRVRNLEHYVCNEKSSARVGQTLRLPFPFSSC